MLTFSLIGTIGRVAQCGDQTIIAVLSSSSSDRGGLSCNWVKVVARNRALCTKLLDLRTHDEVRFDGEIEPRRRLIKGVAFYDVIFVAHTMETLNTSPPAPDIAATQEVKP